jgi:hypothetical protein
VKARAAVRSETPYRRAAAAAGIRSSPTASPSRVRSRVVSLALAGTAGSDSVNVFLSQSWLLQIQRLLCQRSRICRSAMYTSRGVVMTISLTSVAAAPQSGQRRTAPSWPGAVITSATVHPSPACATAVTRTPGSPSSAVAAAHHGAQPGGAGCARPRQPVASTAGGSFCAFWFLGRDENRGGTAFLSAGLRNSQADLWICD